MNYLDVLMRANAEATRAEESKPPNEGGTPPLSSKYLFARAGREFMTGASASSKYVVRIRRRPRLYFRLVGGVFMSSIRLEHRVARLATVVVRGAWVLRRVGGHDGLWKGDALVQQLKAPGSAQEHGSREDARVIR